MEGFTAFLKTIANAGLSDRGTTFVMPLLLIERQIHS